MAQNVFELGDFGLRTGAKVEASEKSAGDRDESRSIFAAEALGLPKSRNSNQDLALSKAESTSQIETRAISNSGSQIEAKAIANPGSQIEAKAIANPGNQIAASTDRWPIPRGIVDKPLELNLTKDEKDRIGKRIWKNESGGTIDGLTAWNKGEEFPSLGIGHFIWMPKGVQTPFGDSFPEAMDFVRSQGATPPAWMKPGMPAPWNSRTEFYKKFDSKEMTELRDFLSKTVPEQTDFIITRLESALPKMLAGTPAAERQIVQERFYKVLNSGAAGVFTLADYVNFKGEGAEDPVGYNGQGWGMRHVLQNMKDSTNPANPVQDFATSAREVLERRVKNAPPERHEERWLKGWTNRVNDYVNNPPLKAPTVGIRRHR